MNLDASTRLHATIDTLLNKHKSNDYVYGKLIHYIENLLPVALDNATELHKQREERRIQLSANRDEFTTRFLQKNDYFYSSQTELFLRYDGLHFVVQSEDDIQHQILSTISSEKCLREWKYKVNKNIIKRIKERSPLMAIPESATIQFVINTLCPSIFHTRNHAKYFLTIIGECLSTKMAIDVNDDGVAGGSSTHVADGASGLVSLAAMPLIYIFPPAFKEIIREIGNQCYTYLGMPNIFTNIKFKYYDHNYKYCRLLSIEKKLENKKMTIAVPSFLAKHMLDFLCVAAHYYSRYGSADNFLQQCSDSRLAEHSLFLTKNTHDSIVTTFIEKSLSSSPSASIDIKNMIFIWKKFLNERAIPNIIFYESLKTILKNKLKYDDTKDCFVGITSIYLPIVSLFMQFWEEKIIEIDGNDDCELGIDELCMFFKQWTNLTKPINETFILELIQHFYPEVAVVNNKYILHIKYNGSIEQ
jgi:hypothetical protein